MVAAVAIKPPVVIDNDSTTIITVDQLNEKNLPAVVEAVEVECEVDLHGFGKTTKLVLPKPKLIIFDILFHVNREGNRTKTVELVGLVYKNSYTAGLSRYLVSADSKFKLDNSTEALLEVEKARTERLGQLSILALSVDRTVGSDPEVFVENKETGKVIPSWHFLGSKEKPNLVAMGQKAYWDGYQAEFTVQSYGCLSYMVDSVRYGLKTVYELAKNKDPKATLSSKTIIEVPMEELAVTEEEYVEFGCKPSFNAYGLTADLGLGGRNITFRSSGGHIHFGFGQRSQSAVNRMVKLLDAVLAVGCVSLFRNFDSPHRRRYYGLPGEYRLPKHGMEYRPLSNAWMFHPVTTNLIFDLARNICGAAINGLDKFYDATEDEIIKTILYCDVEMARKIISRNKTFWMALLTASYPTDKGANAAERAFNAFMEGVETIVANPGDIVGNWQLDQNLWVGHCDGAGKGWLNSQALLDKGQKL